MPGFGAIGELAIGEGPRGRDGDPHALHAEMFRRIAALEEALTKLSPAPGAIGHNIPPDSEPLTADDHAVIRNAIAILKSQSLQTTKRSLEAVAAVERLQSTTSNLGKYLAEKGDIFVSEFAKAAVASAGKWTGQSDSWTPGLAAKTRLARGTAAGTAVPTDKAAPSSTPALRA